MTTKADIAELAGRLAEFVRQVESGNIVLLMRDSKPVARLVPATEIPAATGLPLSIRSLKGHRVLTPVISQAELADELFARE
jgi:antitoxin (DNA-binding transcriptional repressor) of toxin-antitoxin stability system